MSARLEAVREEALYARVLLLFLGMPGVVLAVLLTIAVVAASLDRRRREQALLRRRGATAAQILRIALMEVGMVAVVSGLAGVAIAAIISILVLRTDLGYGGVLTWLAAAFVGAIGLALLANLIPT